ncbi:hypothetical protein EFQ38_09395, partial [Lactobacillus helveticus]|nr:hypothetical protein [Lactobacillus helveticus]
IHQMKSLKENWIKSIKQLNQKCSIYYCNLRNVSFLTVLQKFANFVVMLATYLSFLSKFRVDSLG